MILQSPLNNCLVRIEKRYQDTMGSIKIDPTWRPEEFATLEGIVVSAPINIDEGNSIGTVEKGDKIIFSYGVIYNYAIQPDDDTPVFRNLILYKGEEYWKVDMAEIFCKVTSGIEMVTDHFLIEPLGITRGTYSSSGFMRLDKEIEHKGKVKGLPKNTSLSVRVGDTVYFEPRFVQKYNILGQEHFILPSRRVLAKAN